VRRLTLERANSGLLLADKPQAVQPAMPWSPQGRICVARELPDTGDILIVDDLHDRVIVVDRKTQEIIWQYGQKGVKGHTQGLLG